MSVEAAHSESVAHASGISNSFLSAFSISLLFLIFSSFQIRKTWCMEQLPTPGTLHGPSSNNTPQYDDSHSERSSDPFERRTWQFDANLNDAAGEDAEREREAPPDFMVRRQGDKEKGGRALTNPY